MSQCPPQDCTKCAADEICVLGVASQDNPCPSITCSAAMSNSNSNSGKSSSGTSAGAIAGGVVGGVAAAAIFGFFVWFFCFSKRAQRVREEKEWIPVVGQDHVTGNHTADQQPPSHNPRNSSSTFASLASSALSRASNVIPIAYVPGVTSRGQPSRDSSTGGTLGSNPPIPDVPWEYQFTPEELLRQSRQSTVYGIRDSVNTEAYRESQAYVSSAMMTAIQAKPMLVNVKDGHVTNNNARDSALRQSFMSGTSDGSVYEVASAERVNARSIRIGKAQKVGLQSTYISEEAEEDNGGTGNVRDSTHSAAVPIGLDRPTLGRSLTGNSGVSGTSGVSGVSRKSEVPPLPATLETTNSEAPQLDENIFAGLDIPVQLISTDNGQESPFDDKFRL